MNLQVSVLNLLTLLKEPKDNQQLYNSGCFFGWRHLKHTIRVCLRAGLIDIEYLGREKADVRWVMSHSIHKRRWHKTIYYYYLTSMGLAFISFYDGHQLRKATSSSKSLKDTADESR